MMNHCLMFLALGYLVEYGPATSADFAGKYVDLSREHASMVLSRCHRRGFVSRQPYKRARTFGPDKKIRKESYRKS